MTTIAMKKLFADQLKAERKKLGFTVQILSDLCGTSRSYITLIETGKRMPAKKLLPKIAVALKLKTVTVLNWYLDDIRARMDLD